MADAEKKVRKEPIVIGAIKNGVVLDHIPTEVLMEVLAVLKLHDVKTPWILGKNFGSGKSPTGSKGFIKMIDHFLDDGILDHVALFAPNATVNVIRDGVVDKFKIPIPERVRGLIKCANPNCITNKQGEPFETSFTVSNDDNGGRFLICKYCQKHTARFHLI